MDALDDQFVEAQMGLTELKAVTDTLTTDTNGAQVKAREITKMSVSVDGDLLEAKMQAGSGRYVSVNNDQVELAQTVNGIKTNLELTDKSFKMNVGTRNIL